MTGRSIAAHINDLLAADVCLAPYLDTEGPIIHGGADRCLQPFETHDLPVIRREQQPWPADWCRAVVTLGRFSRSPFQNARDRSRESWTFVIGIFTRSTVRTLDGEEVPGDTWALDIYDQVVRILGWDRVEDRLECGSDILVARKEHEGDVDPLSFQETFRGWRILTRFRWLVIGRGLRIPAALCCEQASVGGSAVAGIPATIGLGGMICGLIEHGIDAHDSCEEHA